MQADVDEKEEKSPSKRRRRLDAEQEQLVRERTDLKQARAKYVKQSAKKHREGNAPGASRIKTKEIAITDLKLACNEKDQQLVTESKKILDLTKEILRLKRSTTTTATTTQSVAQEVQTEEEAVDDFHSAKPPPPDVGYFDAISSAEYQNLSRHLEHLGVTKRFKELWASQNRLKATINDNGSAGSSADLKLELAMVERDMTGILFEAKWLDKQDEIDTLRQENANLKTQLATAMYRIKAFEEHDRELWGPLLSEAATASPNPLSLDSVASSYTIGDDETDQQNHYQSSQSSISANPEIENNIDCDAIWNLETIYKHQPAVSLMNDNE